uniref:Retroviral polymerase SH3-like domain-containing protein n=1 Tax=Lactuca sativa TaxID=4236 RepID=A0A9R1WF11_LACSA|nr:hypothetical protein LSAT_V11C200083760 [Lactuca sativa]
MVLGAGLSLSSWAEAINTTCYTQNQCFCYILNLRDQRSKFDAKADERVFLGYSSISKAFIVINLSRKIVEETILVAFDEDPFIHDRVDHHSLILNEFTFSPLDPIIELLSNEFDPIVPNVDQLISSQLIPVDQHVVHEEADSSNQ